MSDPGLLTRASAAYLQAGAVDAAARCLAQAGNHAGAAGWYLHEHRYVEAARQFYLAGQSETAAWVHVHHLGEPKVAREIMRELPPLGKVVGTADKQAARIAWLDRLCEEILSVHLIDPGVAISQTRTGRAGRADERKRSGARALYSTILLNVLRFSDAGGTAAMSIEQVSLEQLSRIQANVSAREDPQLCSAMTDFEQRLRARVRALNEPVHYRQDGLNLLRRLVDLRCTLAEGAVDRSILTVLEKTRAAVKADASNAESGRLEEWGVAIAELIRRYDRAALIFASSVTAGVPGAAERWQQWSTRVLGAEPTLIDQRDVG